MFQRNLEHVNGVGRGGCVGRAGGHFPRVTGHDPPFRGCSMRAGPKAHVCLPGSASPPACRGSASPPACRAQPHLLPAGALLHLQPAGAVALTAPTASLSRRACQTGRYTQPSPPNARTPAKVAPLVGQKKTRHLPTATRPKPDRLDNPNRPVSILSNSEPALCALAPVLDHQAAPVPGRSHGFTSTCRRAPVAAATPKPA
jgi:hypothetical protein